MSRPSNYYLADGPTQKHSRGVKGVFAILAVAIVSVRACTFKFKSGAVLDGEILESKGTNSLVASNPRNAKPL